MVEPASHPEPRAADDAATDASLLDSDVLRDAVRRARSVDGALGELFERLVGEVGRAEASRLWLQVFSETDASET